jgi:uncharacterized protein (TIGR03067 family)
MQRLALLALFASGSLTIAGAAPVPKQKDDNPDLAALQGKWKLTGMTLEGFSLSVEVADGLGYTLEFQDDKAIFTQTTQKMRTLATVKFDLKAKPRRIVFTNVQTVDLDGKPKVQSGDLGVLIYKIDGDTLVVATNPNDNDGANNEVPADFVGKPGSNTVVMTFKKVKK